MGKISLKGDFVFSGSGKLIPTIKKIKVLKQLGNDLFICGDRFEPELAYSVPIDKVLVYAHIDNQGDSLDNWLVSVILKPAGFVPDPLIDYNQQQSIVGDEEFLTVNKEGIKDSYLLHAPIKNWANHKVHTGNGNTHQLINYSDETISYSYDDSQILEIETSATIDINLGAGSLRPFMLGLTKIVSDESTAKEKIFYKSPYHKIKGLYNSLEFPDPNISFSRAFNLISVQDWILKEMDDYEKKIRKEPKRDPDGKGTTDGPAILEYIRDAAEVGDYIVIGWVREGSWEVSGFTTNFRNYPLVCQGVSPPFPTYTASCSALPFTPPQTVKWCPRGVGSFRMYFRVGNYSFSSTPPNMVILDSPDINGDPIAQFVPSLESQNSGQLKQVGDMLVSVRARGEVRKYKVYQRFIFFN